MGLIGQGGNNHGGSGTLDEFATFHKGRLLLVDAETVVAVAQFVGSGGNKQIFSVPSNDKSFIVEQK
jgi:hypothetical protein